MDTAKLMQTRRAILRKQQENEQLTNETLTSMIKLYRDVVIEIVPRVEILKTTEHDLRMTEILTEIDELLSIINVPK
jgi:CII-binding regulator of phage lambda lysogenization HflD